MNSHADNSESLTVRVSRLIRAPRPQVFDAWLKPEIVRKWWVTGRPEGLSACEIDARPGGRFSFKQIGSLDDEGLGVAPDFEWIMAGVYLEIVACERIVFTWNVNHDPPTTDNRVTIEFRDAPGGTQVDLTHVGSPTRGLRDGTERGWRELLGHMATQLER